MVQAGAPPDRIQQAVESILGHSRDKRPRRASARSRAAARCGSCGPAQLDLDLDAIAVRPALALEKYLVGHPDPGLLTSSVPPAVRA